MEKRAWYQMYVHALDIAALIPSVTDRMMWIDVLAEHDLLLAKMRFEFEFGRDHSSTTNRDMYQKPPLFKHWSLTCRKPQYTDKYPENYDLHEKCVKFDICANV